MPNIIDDLKNGEILDIQSMPAGNEKPKVKRIPSPLPFQKESSRDNINLDYVRCTIPEICVDSHRFSCPNFRIWMIQ